MLLKQNRLFFTLLSLCAATITQPSCATAPKTTESSPGLSAVSPQKTPVLVGWHGDNWARIEAIIKRYGVKAASYDPSRKPVAAFDWDNTVIKNDSEDATIFWMVSHNLVKKPVDWKNTSAFLKPEAIDALNKNCRDDLPSPLPTNENAACADLILSIYDSGTLQDGNKAWQDKSENGAFNPDTIKPEYAWGAQLTAGYTAEEIRRFAKDAMGFNMKNPIGAKQKIGSKSYNASVRIYPQIKSLIKLLQANGFDVWVVSATPQNMVEVYAKEAGVARDHVIGIRSVMTKKGVGAPVATYGFEGCGTHPNGNQTLITYRQGKRCWINKIVFGDKDLIRMMTQSSDIAFGAGDSDTDVFFLKDAHERLVLNRNKTELMCNAYASGWIINPMFIDPNPEQVAGYKCGKFNLPDQEDKIH